MLRSLVLQLLENGASLPPTLESIVADDKSPSTGQLPNMLREMIENLMQSYIVIDALDECNDQDELLKVLTKIASWDLDHLHLLVTSRPEPDIKYSLEQIVEGNNRICLQTELVDADILKYVHHRLSKDRKLQKFQQDPEAQRQIETKLAEGAQGM